MASRKRAVVRPRNATNTREAILASARTAFTRAGYDGAGVREIASGAGVTAMLVNRYFGSKERLFAEVVAQTMDAPIILTPEILESDNPGEAIAAALVDLTGSESNPLDGFLIMHRSGSSRRAAEIAREQIEERHHKTMTAALTGKLAPQRAAVVLAIVAGIQIMRQMIGLSALSKARRKDLVQILAPLFQQLIDGAASRERD